MAFLPLFHTIALGYWYHSLCEFGIHVRTFDHIPCLGYLDEYLGHNYLPCSICWLNSLYLQFGAWSAWSCLVDLSCAITSGGVYASLYLWQLFPWETKIVSMACRDSGRVLCSYWHYAHSAQIIDVGYWQRTWGEMRGNHPKPCLEQWKCVLSAVRSLDWQYYTRSRLRLFCVWQEDIRTPNAVSGVQSRRHFWQSFQQTGMSCPSCELGQHLTFQLPTQLLPTFHRRPNKC